MCYDNDARPPEPANKLGSAQGQELILTSEDGNRFAAYLAQPANPTGEQVVIFPDVRGLHQFYRELALRFAEMGVRALGIDYFGRTAGLTARDDTFEYMPHVMQLTGPGFLNDVKAALSYLRQETTASQTPSVLGFCLGGSFSLLAAREDLGLGGAVAFYAGLSRQLSGTEGTILELASSIRVPVLGLFGGADQGIPVEDVHKLEDALKTSGVEHKVVIYPDAPHSFFDRKSVEFAEASSDAWSRALTFIHAHKG